MITLLLTFIPSMLIGIYIIRSDKFPEPFDMLLGAFCLGFLICLPAGLLNEQFIFSKDNPSDYAFIAGLTEETLKFLVFMLYIRRRCEFDEPMDAIVYGTLISLGFATYENYEYVYLYNEPLTSYQVAAIRALSAIPLHASCGVIMGFFIGKSIHCNDKKYLLSALIVPIVLHAFYNYLDNILLSFALVTISLFACIKLHNQVKFNQRKEVSGYE